MKPILEERPRSARHANGLRQELCERNRLWAIAHSHAHEETRGRVPAVLYREDDTGRHGNFLEDAYRSIRADPTWNRRLQKVHSTARQALLSHDRHRKELDSCYSSDALLMNIFCHPGTLASSDGRRFLQISSDTRPEFGYRPKTPLQQGRRDNTEIDMKIDDLLIEAKLTEYDFQYAPMRLVERYASLREVFDCDALERSGDRVGSYQLIRGVMAVERSSYLRFGVVCDARRPDLVDRWHRLLRAVKPYDLRCRLVLFTWQEIAAFVPKSVGEFLADKYGILPKQLEIAPRGLQQRG